MNEINQIIQPFKFIEYETDVGKGYSVILNVGEYKNHIFEMRKNDGFEGGGYDWASLASAFLDLYLSHLAQCVNFDPEADMFSAHSADKAVLVTFITQFHEFCENEPKMIELFNTIEID